MRLVHNFLVCIYPWIWMVQFHRLKGMPSLTGLGKEDVEGLRPMHHSPVPPSEPVPTIPVADWLDSAEVRPGSSEEPAKLSEESAKLTPSTFTSSASPDLTTNSDSPRHPPDHPDISSEETIKKEEIPSSYGNFDRKLDPFHHESSSIRLVKWKSRKTGLTVVWGDVEGPLVNGHIVVATEIFDDSGIPHTLEHLIFLGSKRYPHKGVLNSLAHRAFSDGPNAFTHQTFTDYILTTAGSDGFLRLLPIYLDHVFFPTLTPEGFTTEVFHINGKGEEAGVVFSEMQARENTDSDLMALRKNWLLYPAGSGYGSQTSGLMSALRVLTVDQIRKYHNDQYQPRNVQLIVTGKVDPTELLEVLNSKVEPLLENDSRFKPLADWKRPFLETSSKGGARIDHEQTVEVDFPEQDESMGEIQISWVGPEINDLTSQAALGVLFDYLTDSTVSPLAKKFIEIESPLCTGISFYQVEEENTVITAYLSSVPSEHLSAIGNLVKEAIHEEALALDFDRLQMVIKRIALQVASEMENFAHEQLSSIIISNFLYGKDSDLVSNLQFRYQRYKNLEDWTIDQWAATLKKWLVEKPSLCIIGKPSAELMKNLKLDSSKRVQENAAKHNPGGLEELGKKLELAQEINNKSFPQKFIENFPVPPLDSIRWIDVDIADSFRSHKSALQLHLDSHDDATLPFFVQFNHINSNFVTIDVDLSPANIPEELFPLLSIYKSSFFSLPIKRKDGTQLSHTKVVNQLDHNTVGYHIRFGSPLSETLEISLEVEKSKYDEAIGWLHDLMYGSIFDIERLRRITTQDLQDIPYMKRDGDTIANEIYIQMVYDPHRSIKAAVSLFQQEKFLPNVLERLKSDPENLINQMKQLRSHLLQTSSMRISVSGDIYSLQKPKSSWTNYFDSVQVEKLKKIPFGNSVLTSDGTNPSGKVCVMSLPFIESSYATFDALGPQGFDHPDEAALSVAKNFLNAMEGYLWNEIRGSGLAYGVWFGYNIETGHVYFDIYRSSQSFEAFIKTKRVIQDLVDNKLRFDKDMLETAKSTTVFDIANQNDTGTNSARRAFIDVAMRGVSKESGKQLLEKVASLTVEDVLKAIKKYLLPIFNPKSSLAAIASDSIQSEEIAEKLKSQGYQVEVKDIQSNNSPLKHDDASDSSSTSLNSREEIDGNGATIQKNEIKN